MTKHEELLDAGWAREEAASGVVYTHPNYPNTIGYGWHISAALKFTRDPAAWALQQSKMATMNARVDEFDKRGAK